MPTTTQDFISEINFTRPFLLFVGRKQRLIEKPSRFVHKRTHLVFDYDETMMSPDFIAPTPSSEEFSLFIDGKPFSTTYPTGTRRNSVRMLMNPTDRSKALIESLTEIHLVKKYTSLH